MKIEDFKALVLIIDTCSKRGAFQGDELLTVGKLREELLQFIQAQAIASVAPEEDDTET